MFIRPSYVEKSEKQKILERLWQKDPSLWSKDEEEQTFISNRMGWLDLFPKMKAHLDEIEEFAQTIKNEGFERIVLLGMGGSSLCPLVLSKIFGSSPGYPKLEVLDTTDPVEIEKVENENNWEKTLFIFASKSGTTVEPNAQFNYFWPIVEKSVDAPGNHFIAITDPGTPLEKLAQEKGFRKTFLNMSDIGGRYAALSFFGLVPAALMGIDIKKLLASGEEMAAKCGPDIDWDDNPACRLGEFLGEYGMQSKDKLNLFADKPFDPFGLWLEQLIAESTGKETRGIVPIVGESTGIPGFYGGERIFAYFRNVNLPEEDTYISFIKELREAGFPVYEIPLSDPYDLGGQFFLWEMATALASVFIGVNPFNEPDVKLAKEKTKEIIQFYQENKKMPVKFWVDVQSNINFATSKLVAISMKSLARALRDMLNVVPSWGYVGFLPYLPYDPEVEEIIAEMRQLVRLEMGCATVMGFGPRYLHSTGQVHKGGPMSVALLIFTRKREKEYPPVPGFDMSFWHIQFAQAVGDFQAIDHEHRRVIHIHLPQDYKLGLTSFSKVLARAIKL